MNRQSSFNNDVATLYLIPTPIGNLEDITVRAINILKEVKFLYAEDTRVTVKLLNHYEIKTPLKSCHSHNEEEKTLEIISKLEEGMDIGLVSDAGMPSISDPGFGVVKQVLDNEFNVVALPGPSASLTALVASGIESNTFSFYGFLDHKASRKRKQIRSFKNNSETIVIYESPHRIFETLKILFEELGNRRASVCREITKKFEEYIRFELKDYEQVDNIKGEIVVVISGYDGEIEIDESISVIDQINIYLKKEYSEKEAIKMVAKERNLVKNEVYMEYVNYKNLN